MNSFLLPRRAGRISPWHASCYVVWLILNLNWQLSLHSLVLQLLLVVYNTKWRVPTIVQPAIWYLRLLARLNFDLRSLLMLFDETISVVHRLNVNDFACLPTINP